MGSYGNDVFWFLDCAILSIRSIDSENYRDLFNNSLLYLHDKISIIYKCQL